MLCIQTVFVCLLLAQGASTATSRTCYGDVDKLSPTGQTTGGVVASQTDVQDDLPDLLLLKKCFDQTADKNCIQASVIAAIASRASRAGKLIKDNNGYGDDNHSWGIMQCSLLYSGLPCRTCGWNSCCHVEMMVSKLFVPYINQVTTQHPSWTPDQQLQGAVAAYHCGVSRVKIWKDVDVCSYHGDYSNDVMARAQWLRKHGWD